MAQGRVFGVLVAALLLLAGCGGAASPSTPDPSRPAGADLPSATTQVGAQAEPSATVAAPAAAEATPTAQHSSEPFTPIDGGVLYYHFDEQLLRGELWVTREDRAEDQLLTACAAPCDISHLALTPDKRQLAYVAVPQGEAGTLRIVSLSTGADYALADDVHGISERPFSPDGTRIAFLRDHPSDPGIIPDSLWVVDVAGGAPREIMAPRNYVSGPQWTDDSHLVISSSNWLGPETELFIVDVDATPPLSPTALLRGDFLDLSPDRSRMFVKLHPEEQGGAEGGYSLLPVDVAPGAIEPVFRLTRPLGRFAWSPDGQSLAVFDSGARVFYHVRLADGSFEELTRVPVEAVIPVIFAWDPSGDAIIYSLSQEGLAEITDLRRVTLADKVDQPLTTFPGDYELWLLLPES